ncbi:hypothetical protein [Nonomuraea sp. 10N515B]|uniref:hypothetical protein n=1 Tax=Nonomuraea sp. 10N515B TaxID=3457422 RepID=UPI003FCC896F
MVEVHRKDHGHSLALPVTAGEMLQGSGDGGLETLGAEFFGSLIEEICVYVDHSTHGGSLAGRDDAVDR